MPSRKKTVEEAAERAVADHTAKPAKPSPKRTKAQAKELAKETMGESALVQAPPPEAQVHLAASPDALPVVPPPFRLAKASVSSGQLTAAKYAKKLRSLPEEQQVGEMKLTESGALLNHYLEYYGFTAPFIEAMNQFYDSRIAQLIANTTLKHPNGGRVHYENLILLPPSELNVAGDMGVKTHGLKAKALFPNQCRLEGATYNAAMYLDWVHRADDGTELARVKNRFCGKIPVMLGSSLCHLAGKTDKERFQMGEGGEDPLGYFVIEGSEKIIMGQVRARKNAIQLIESKEDGVVCNMSAITSRGQHSSVVLALNPKTEAIRLRMRFLGNNATKDKPRSLPALMAFRLLGIESVDEMVALICRFSKPQNARRIWMALIPSIDQIQKIGNDYQYIAVIKGTTETPEAHRHAVDIDFHRDFFAHMNGPDEPLLNYRKANLYAMMLCRMNEAMAGLRPLDDRDDWANKRVEGAATAYEHLFGILWNRFNDAIQKTIDENAQKKEFSNYTIDLIARHARPEMITDEFSRSFNGNWGASNISGPGKHSTNIVEQLRREGTLSTYSQMLRVRTPSNEKNKDTALRFIHFTQGRYICTVDTAEGPTCGLVGSLAQTAYPSIERDDTLLIATLTPMLSRNGPTPVAGSPCLVNGKFLGWIDGKAARERVIQGRRNDTFAKDISVLNDTEANDKAFYVFTDANRLTAPLLVVNPETHRLVVDELGLRGEGIETLRLRGAIEFIGAVEEAVLRVAPTVEDLKQREATLTTLLGNLTLAKKEGDPDAIAIAEKAFTAEFNRRAYTHCEIDPTAQLGVAAAAIPLANHNQAPRNVYQCGTIYTGVLTPSDGGNVRVRLLGDLRNGDKVFTVNTDSGTVETTRIKNHFVIRPQRPVLSVKLLDNTVLELTDDHKMWCSRPVEAINKVHTAGPGFEIVDAGMCEVKDMSTNTLLARPFVMNPVSAVVEETVVLDSASLIERLQPYKEHCIPNKIAKELSERGILPLMSTSTRLPILGRIYGYCLTDGSLAYNLSSFVGCFGTARDAEDFESDMALIGFNVFEPKETFGVFKSHDRMTQMHTWNVSHGKALAALIVALGACPGKKQVNARPPIPEWIMKGSDLVKREFLAGVMGGDGCALHHGDTGSGLKPRKHGQVVCMEGLIQHTEASLIGHLKSEFDQIASLFTHFGIEVLHVKVKPSPDNPAYLGCNLKLSDTHENLRRFMHTIGYRYARFKQDAGVLRVSYLDFKSTFIAKRTALKQSIQRLSGEGMRPCDIARRLEIPDKMCRDILRYQAKTDYAGARECMTIHEWCSRVTCRYGLLYVPVTSVTPTNVEWVSDFETESPNHTFLMAAGVGPGEVPADPLTLGGFISSNCSMGRQSLGIYHSNYTKRFDTTAKILAWPSRPIFEPQINQLIGLSDNPQGQTVRVLFGVFEGWGQEDAFIFNKASIDRGLFLRAKLTGHKVMQKKTAKFNDVILNPLAPTDEALLDIKGSIPGQRSLLEKAQRNKKAYEHLDERGIVKLGTYVKAHDCLVGMTRIISERVNRTLTGNKIEEDMSLYVPLHEEGQVVSVLVTNSSENAQIARVVRIRLQKVGKPELGDKFAPRHAQKGTIGLILRPEDMPFDKDGIAPDMIVNPHAFPSRMTMGTMIETIMSKMGALSGETINATTFVKPDQDAAARTLIQYGYHSNGSEEFYSGITGRKMGTGMLFTGPVFVQSLRHHVSDKYQATNAAPIDPLTRQPMRGRNRGGAIRVGEMERDAFLGLGVVQVMQESLCLRSDATEVVFCKRCGTIAIEDRAGKQTTCRVCKDKGTFSRTILPYVFVSMVRLLRAAGISMTVKTANEMQVRMSERRETDQLRTAAELRAEELAAQTEGGEGEEGEEEEEEEELFNEEEEYGDEFGEEGGDEGEGGGYGNYD